MREYASLRNCVRLSAASGTVCKYSSIVSVQHTVQQVLCSRFVYIGLCGVLVEHTIKRKGLVLDSLALGNDGA